MVLEKPKPTRPAHIIALEKLAKLKEKKLWQSDKVKQYHIELSEVLREYLENRYYVTALEQTTYEILINMRSVQIENEPMEKLKQLLTLSDLVKFAKEQPLATENEMCMQHAYEVVEQTKMLSERIPEADENISYSSAPIVIRYMI